MNILYISIVLITQLMMLNLKTLKHTIDYVYKKIADTPLRYTDGLFKTNITTDSIQFFAPGCDYVLDAKNPKLEKYQSCHVLALMNLTVTILPNYTFFFSNFHFDIYYDEIKYEQQNNKTIIPFIKSTIDDSVIEPVKFNFNRTPLSSMFFANFTLIIIKTGSYLREQYIEIIEKAFNNSDGRTQLEADLFSAFTLMYLDSIVVKNKGKAVTYYAFHIPKCLNIINLNEITFIGSLTAIFEYSIDYNITYQEGNFTIKNFVFEKLIMNDENAFNNYKYLDFNPPGEREDIKDYMFAKFKDWLVLSIKKLYLQKEMVDWWDGYLDT